MKEPSVQQILQIVHHICLDTTAGVRHLWPVEYIKFKSTMKLQWRTTGVIHKHVVRTWSTVRATHAPSRSFSSDSSRASILKLIAWKKKHNGKVSESTFVCFTCMIFVYEPVFSKTEKPALMVVREDVVDTTLSWRVVKQRCGLDSPFCTSQHSFSNAIDRILLKANILIVF